MPQYKIKKGTPAARFLDLLKESDKAGQNEAALIQLLRQLNPEAISHLLNHQFEHVIDDKAGKFTASGISVLVYIVRFQLHDVIIEILKLEPDLEWGYALPDTPENRKLKLSNMNVLQIAMLNWDLSQRKSKDTFLMMLEKIEIDLVVEAFPTCLDLERPNFIAFKILFDKHHNKMTEEIITLAIKNFKLLFENYSGVLKDLLEYSQIAALDDPINALRFQIQFISQLTLQLFEKFPTIVIKLINIVAPMIDHTNPIIREKFQSLLQTAFGLKAKDTDLNEIYIELFMTFCRLPALSYLHTFFFDPKRGMGIRLDQLKLSSSPLVEAVNNINKPVIKMLIAWDQLWCKKSPNYQSIINKMDDKLELTAIHQAIFIWFSSNDNSLLEVIKLLLSAGADPKITIESKFDILNVLASMANSSPAVFEDLKKLDPNILDYQNNPLNHPIFSTIDVGNVELFSYFLNQSPKLIAQPYLTSQSKLLDLVIIKKEITMFKLIFKKIHEFNLKQPSRIYILDCCLAGEFTEGLNFILSEFDIFKFDDSIIKDLAAYFLKSAATYGKLSIIQYVYEKFGEKTNEDRLVIDKVMLDYKNSKPDSAVTLLSSNNLTLFSHKNQSIEQVGNSDSNNSINSAAFIVQCLDFYKKQTVSESKLLQSLILAIELFQTDTIEAILLRFPNLIHANLDLEWHFDYPARPLVYICMQWQNNPEFVKAAFTLLVKMGANPDEHFNVASNNNASLTIANMFNDPDLLTFLQPFLKVKESKSLPSSGTSETFTFPEASESESTSARAYFAKNFGDQGLELFKEFKGTSGKEEIVATLPLTIPRPPTTKSITIGEDHVITVQFIEGNDDQPIYFFLRREILDDLEDQIHENKFRKLMTEPKFDNYHGIKLLSGDQARKTAKQSYVTINNETIHGDLLYEIKIHGLPTRIICTVFLIDETRVMIPMILFKNGLHNNNDKERLAIKTLTFNLTPDFEAPGLKK